MIDNITTAIVVGISYLLLCILCNVVAIVIIKLIPNDLFSDATDWRYVAIAQAVKGQSIIATIVDKLGSFDFINIVLQPVSLLSMVVGLALLVYSREK